MEPVTQTAGAMAPPGILMRGNHDGIATLTLNRPQARNALSAALIAALRHELDEIREDPSVRVVVLAANGPAFCAGHDLKEMRQNPDRESYHALFTQCSHMMLSLVRLPKPVIAKVQGVATAAGCQLVASCDLAVATRRAEFATPGVQIGLFCSTPMVALSRAVGRKHAMEMLLTGQRVSAERAHEMGLINRVVVEEKLDCEVEELAQGIAAKSALTVALGKEAFYRQLELDLDKAYDYASEVMTRNMLAADAAEGIDAFLEKRPPHFRGC